MKIPTSEYQKVCESQALPCKLIVVLQLREPTHPVLTCMYVRTFTEDQ